MRTFRIEYLVPYVHLHIFVFVVCSFIFGQCCNIEHLFIKMELDDKICTFNSDYLVHRLFGTTA